MDIKKREGLFNVKKNILILCLFLFSFYIIQAIVQEYPKCVEDIYIVTIGMKALNL